MPARRVFLKSRSAETAMCRSVFLDKSLPYPDIAFRFFADNVLKSFFPAAGLLERVSAAYAHLLPPSLETVELSGEGFRLRAILGRPEAARKDRRLLQIFINGIRISSYPLSQAVEYAYGSAVPGGLYPVAFLFFDIDPELVDFNVHPAKREVRIREQGRIHSAVVGGLRDYLGLFSISVQENGSWTEQRDLPRDAAAGEPGAGPPPYSASLQSAGRTVDWKGRVEAITAPAQSAIAPYRYIGQLFNLFLLVEGPSSLFIIDQHAAHERIVFDGVMAGEKTPQELLFPISFDVSPNEEERMLERFPRLGELGFRIERTGTLSFEITAVAEAYSAVEEGQLVSVLKSPDPSLRVLEEEMARLVACRTAIKDGERMDPTAAVELIRKTLDLRDARCPHGRPIWHEISRRDLHRFVGRT